MNKTDSRQQARKDMMLNEPVSRIITKMAFPTIIAFLINSIYSLADTYFVSSLGTNATAAVSVNASLDQLILMAGSMLGIGATSYISRLLGAKDEDKASSVLSTAFFARDSNILPYFIPLVKSFFKIFYYFLKKYFSKRY